MDTLPTIIESYRNDVHSVYNTWFINSNERLKAFRSIRRGVAQVVEDIRSGIFPNDFKGSSLEFILTCITEQQEVFEGAAHPFYWKPKLRIPDIYESQENKRLFGQFLEHCLQTTDEESILRAIIRLDTAKIKGLGPAVANIIYFLHPTLFPPFNTAIVKGYNILFNEKRKLGSWSEYLAMRDTIRSVNQEYKQLFSNDLGAVSGLLFEIGLNRVLVNPEQVESALNKEINTSGISKQRQRVVNEIEEASLHTEMQFHLLKIGTALGYNALPASNDRTKSYKDQSFNFMMQGELRLPGIDKETDNTIRLIDVLWFTKDTGSIVSAFEIEKSTSIYSGILRLTDLSFALPRDQRNLFIVIPDAREKDLLLQLKRPSIKNNGIVIHYILFSELRTHCDALCKFGDSHEIMKKISKTA